ncbi:MAG: TIGR00730 family Rossman fold protein [Dysgonamonadaceae bacterium]|jgi:uncharacterized protein (TIGR00730 family)|nr:TIGR00730 family Rossman fold protein [Dysgonamonadaceae bacterium]
MQKPINAITVYAASSCKIDETYIDAARELGRLLAKRSITCVYGGGPNGLMGAVADAALDSGGQVCGVIPQFMIDRGWINRRLTETVVTEGMHERKRIMAERSDALIALPGGIGTLEELFEAMAWRQLGLITKPLVVINTGGFYDSLFDLLQKISDENFMRHENSELFSVAKTPEEALEIIDFQLANPIKPLE